MISVGSQGTRPNAKSDALGTKVFPVARLAVDLPLPLTELATVHPLVADVAGEAGLVPRLPRRPHQLGDEDGLATPGTDLCPAPLGLHSVGDVGHLLHWLDQLGRTSID